MNQKSRTSGIGTNETRRKIYFMVRKFPKLKSYTDEEDWRIIYSFRTLLWRR